VCVGRRNNLAAKSRAARGGRRLQRSTLVPASDSHGSPDELRGLFRRPGSSTLQRLRLQRRPYADSDFKVQRRSHRRERLSLKETLLQRSEAQLAPNCSGDSTAPVPVAVRLRGCRPRRQVLKADLTSGLRSVAESGTSRWTATRAPCSPQCKDIKDIVDHSSVGGFAVDRRAAASPVIPRCTPEEHL